MLVLTRQHNERVVLRVTQELPVGTEIVVTVTSIRGAKVRLGFDAPTKVEILRGELLRGEGSSPDEPE